MGDIREAPKIDGRRKYLNVEEVAEHFGVGISTVYKEIKRGNLEAVRVPGLRIHVDEIARYEEARKVSGGIKTGIRYQPKRQKGDNEEPQRKERKPSGTSRTGIPGHNG